MTKSYHNFIGIDIGKFNFVVNYHGEKKTTEFTNDKEGIKLFLKNSKINKNSLVILEATGGYEMDVILALHNQNIDVHRANSRKVKNFIRSFGNKAKTDSLDAKALANYGYERHKQLDIFKILPESHFKLYSFVKRRQELVKLSTSEKNRKSSPESKYLLESINDILNFLKNEIEKITDQINKIIESDEQFEDKIEILESIPGVGRITAFSILSLVPELGTMDRRSIASLTGLAPMSNDSGKMRGYRCVTFGRNSIKPILFTASMAARRSKTSLRKYYDSMIERGKVKMVALTALMRKIIVIANAIMKQYLEGKSVKEIISNGKSLLTA